MPAFNAYIREKGQGLLDEIDNWLSKLDPPDGEDQDDIVSTGLGIYHYVVRDEDEEKDIKELLQNRSQHK